MKLEKREITLNERDSLKDVYYLEESLCFAYASGKRNNFRKEAVSAFAFLQTQTEEEKKLVEKLLEKSRKNDF